MNVKNIHSKRGKTKIMIKLKKKWRQTPWVLKLRISTQNNNYSFVVENEKVFNFMYDILDDKQIKDLATSIFENGIHGIIPYKKFKERRRSIRKLLIYLSKKYYYDLLFWLNKYEDHRKMVAWMETDGKEDIPDLFINAYREERNKLYLMAKNALEKWIGFLIREISL